MRCDANYFILQAFDAPWPIIQANAMYFCSSMLSQTDDQRILALYYSQVNSPPKMKKPHHLNALVSVLEFLIYYLTIKFVVF